MPRRPTALLAAAALLALAGCRSGPPAGRTLTVLAAASLTGSITRLATDFERSHPGVRVRVSVGSSATLAQQAVAGAPADLLATASAATMRTAERAGAARDPVTFARNVAAVAVYPPRRAAVRSLSDLAAPGVSVALCAPAVPCGALAATVLRRAGVTVRPVTLGTDVSSTLAYVVRGEVDAAVVYRTDVQAAGPAVVPVPVPAAVNAATDYQAAVLRQAAAPDLARAFLDLLRSPAGQRVLADAGFAPPGPAG